MLTLATLLFFFSMTPAAAEGWNWSITPYLWASSVTLDVNVNGSKVIEAGADFKDILDDTDFAFMVHVEGRKGKGGLLFDLITLDLGDDRRRFESGSTAKTDLEMTIIELGGTYTPAGDELGFALLGGLRVIDVDQEIDFTTPGPGPRQSERFEASDTLYDGFVGLRYLAKSDNGWSFNARGDIATGDTDFTWNALAGLGYHFGSEDRYGVLLGYRYMDFEFDQADERARVESELTLSGAYLGFQFAF